nr:hypothetical protein [Lentilactobacillus otakiensis]
MNKRFYIATAITAALGVAALMTPAHAAATDPTTPTSTSSSSTKSKTSKDTTPKVIPAATIVSTEDYDQPLPYHMKSGYVYTTSGLNKTLGSAKNFAKITWYTYKKKLSSTALHKAKATLSGTMLRVVPVSKAAGFGTAVSRIFRKERLTSQ